MFRGKRASGMFALSLRVTAIPFRFLGMQFFVVVRVWSSSKDSDLKGSVLA